MATPDPSGLSKGDRVKLVADVTYKSASEVNLGVPMSTVVVGDIVSILTVSVFSDSWFPARSTAK